jgi:hypothetical protein
MEMIPVVAILSSFGAAVLIMYFITRTRQRRAELQAEMQSKLIDRFGSAPEMITFLQSDAGRDFVAGVQSAPETLLRDRIIGSFTRSIILTSFGGGFVFLAFWADDAFAIPAALLFSLGIGYFIATIVSWKLSTSLTAK